MAEKDFRSRFGAKDLEGEEGGGCGRGCPGRFPGDSLWESLLKGRYLQ
jgi:hypothetical protein